MIQKSQYDLFLNNVINELDGDWVLIGGSLLIIAGASKRPTADIDLCPIGELNNEKRIALMEIAKKSQLPIEAINPSADFFLRQIPNWKSSLSILISGNKGSSFNNSKFWKLLDSIKN